ncbi:hypothetical protein L6164_032555 [Bauhinia variegata]|uniref:Uncharacterized protein n=4 Tax=Bauhinia variegata TaxID=167791 RepID=A0ACB9KPE7_BAUVA|nr:hypothetical protein L6164_032555 [Bauhinia variegata]
MSSEYEARKPHAVLVPYPTQGHINPFLKLAKLLHSKGFSITLVNSEFNHKRLLNSRGPDALKGFPDFRFESIPDGLPPSNKDATQSIVALCDSTRKNCSVPFSNLLSKLNDSQASGAPPVSCIISDGIMSFTLEASQQLRIPNVFFWTNSACGFMSFKVCNNLMERGLIPLKDASYLTNGHLDTIIDWIPGMKNISLRDLPGIYRTTDPNDILLDFVVEQIEATSKASAVILPTFNALEPEILDALSSMFPKLYTIGPLELLLDHAADSSLESINCSLWKEESECLKWLDSKETNSVLYVNFGSVIVMSPQKLVEFAWGLANGKKNFLWVIRPDLIEGDAAVVPPEIVAETRERGLMVDWCPQEKVLKHPAIAGFLSHCGWNSTLESITSGVPLICCPFFNDQIVNSRYVCTEWGLGMKMDSDDVKRDEVEKLVRELVHSEKGKKMREKAMWWKKMAEEATGANGSSFLNLEILINQVLL